MLDLPKMMQYFLETEDSEHASHLTILTYENRAAKPLRAWRGKESKFEKKSDIDVH